MVNDLCAPRDSGLVDDEGSDLKIIWLFEKLNSQAIKKGGAVISVLGNHELMNVEGDFRYVSPREFKEFATFFKEKNKNDGFPHGYESRKRVFSPGGAIAKKLGSSRYSIVQVGSWVFVHGGISPRLANEYTDNINTIIKDWLHGKTDAAPRSMLLKFIVLMMKPVHLSGIECTPNLMNGMKVQKKNSYNA